MPPGANTQRTRTQGARPWGLRRQSRLDPSHPSASSHDQLLAPDGETLSTLIGMAAYVYMSDPKKGEGFLDALRELDRSTASALATIKGPPTHA